MKLFEVAQQYHSKDPVTKPLDYYFRYQNFLINHSLTPLSIFEVGTYFGESAKILSLAFPESKIVTLDFEDRKIDFTQFPNVRPVFGDQGNAEFLDSLVQEYFPDGLDLVIDDASHIGSYTLATFQSLMPAVKPGGAYFVEDWGTGYWDEWLDGAKFASPRLITPGRFSRNRNKAIVKSHDAGMVGFVKSLVDLTHLDAARLEGKDALREMRISALEFGPGVCMALKRPSSV
jgi:SAM-dependent methyltransferase